MPQTPNQELNPHPLHWKHGVLITGPPGKSCGALFVAQTKRPQTPEAAASPFFCLNTPLILYPMPWFYPSWNLNPRASSDPDGMLQILL